MDYMGSASWTALVVAVIGAVGSIALQALHMYLSYRRDLTIRADVDTNTRITKAGTAAASANAKIAADTAVEAKSATEAMSRSVEKKLNGGLDVAIETAVVPFRTALEQHVAKDAEDMEELKVKIKEITDYVHGRNHDILDALQLQSNKIGLLLKMSGEGGKV